MGPSPHLDPSAVAASRGAAVVALLGASLVAAGVGVVFAWGGLRSSPSVTHRPRWIPWEPVALALAAATGFQLLVRSDGTRGEPGAISLLVVAFPLLAIAALVGLAVRALARGLPALATIWPSRLPFVLWIATRRVARLPAHALTLVGTGGMALGLFVYFCALATSSGSALDAKSAALAGAETTSRLFTTWRIEPGLPRSMPDDTTFVWRDSATIEPGDIRVDVLAVDPETFGQGAAWRPTFADAPLDAVLREAGAAPSTGPDTAAVIAVGDTAEGQTLPDTGQLISGGWGAIGFEVVTRPEAFPGMQENIPLVVVDARRFFSLIGPYDPTDPETQVNPIRQVFRPEIWSAGAPAHVERYLAGRDTPLLDVETRRRIATRPDLLAPSWALSHLVALGTAIGALALGALFVYADQRRVQRATSYALARRMGLSQRTNVAATALEMLAVLAVAFVVGVGAALLIGAAVAGSVDPVPLLAPAPQLQVPVTAIGLAALISVLAAAAASAWLQLRAERTDVAEVLRVAE